MQPEIKPATIFRHACGIYPPMAMLAGMQLDVFNPLKDGPMTAARVASRCTAGLFGFFNSRGRAVFPAK
jgi:hypothetical protein